MVTDRDIVCKGLAKDNFDVHRATARDVMTSGIHCCIEDELFLWARCIDGSADSKAVATYVSRGLTPTLWEREDLWFSQ